MTYIIVDDEPLAHEVIIKYAESFDFLKLVHQSYHAVDAIEWLQSESTDLIFLDIQMPKISGMSMLQMLKERPAVIITSAFEEYAVESFNYDVVDYLLKPYSIDRFYSAIQRARKQQAFLRHGPKEETQIFIKGDKKHHQVNFLGISLVEGYGQYCKVYNEDEVILTLDRLANIEASLPLDDFLRVHKSYIVSISKIKSIEGNTITVNGQKIPIGQSYRKSVKEVLKLK